jgi:hypothetical protein
MNRFAPLMSQIVDSSLWREEYYVRILFTTMLAKKDSDHVVRATPYNLHLWANITQEECLEGLKILESPDKKRLDWQEHDGRRIEKVEGGWLVLNGHKYEEEMRRVAEQARKAKWARENRARESAKRASENLVKARYRKNGDEIGLADVNSMCPPETPTKPLTQSLSDPEVMGTSESVFPGKITLGTEEF